MTTSPSGMFDLQDDGSVLGVLTERAVAWSDGDKNKIACIGFAGFCRDMSLDPFWAVDDPDVIALSVGNTPHVVRIHADEGGDNDTFLIREVDGEGWDVIVRVLPGATPMVHILGISGCLHQKFMADVPLARSVLLPIRDWLTQWSHHHRRSAA